MRPLLLTAACVQQSSTCFHPPNDNCTDLTTTYLWNITNPAQARAVSRAGVV